MPVHDPHPAIIDAQSVGADLRHDRLKALPERGSAGDDLDDACLVDRNPDRIARAETALLDKNGDAGADRLAGGPALAQPCLQRLPLDGPERLVHQRGIVARIVDDPIAECIERKFIGHFRPGDQIAAAHLDRVDPELGGDCVQQPLAHKGALVAARRAIGRRRGLVGQPDMPGDAIGRDPIGPRQQARRHIRDACAVRAQIGALIVKKGVVDRQNTAAAVDRGADTMALLA